MSLIEKLQKIRTQIENEFLEDAIDDVDTLIYEIEHTQFLDNGYEN